MEMRAEQTIEGIRALETALRTAYQRGLSRTTAYAHQLAASTRTFKDRTGYARGSIAHGVRSTFHHFVRAGGSAAPHLRFLDSGTRAHEIRPKLGRNFIGPARPGQTRSRGAAKPVLRFIVAGQWRSARMVKHPGTAALHFMQDARDGAEQRAGEFFAAEMNAVIHR